MKRFVYLLVMISLFLTVIFSTGAFADNVNQSVKQANIKASCAIYENMIRDFKFKYAQGFPDFYAGSYLDDNGILNVLLTSKSEYNTNAIKKAGQTNAGHEEISFKEAKYSYNYLTKLKESFRNRMNELGFKAMGIDQINNVLNIYIEESSDSNKMTSFADDPAINLIKAEVDIKNEATELILGEALTTQTQSFSLGFCSLYNSDPVVVTAGHGRTIGENIYYNGSLVGQIDGIACGGTCDAAYAKIDNLNIWTPTGKVLLLQELWSWSDFDYFPVNGDVTRFGAVKQVSSGVVLQHNFDFVSGGVEFYDSILTSCKSEQGDSGGPYTSKSPIYGDVFLRGIHHGSLTINGERIGAK